MFELLITVMIPAVAVNVIWIDSLLRELFEILVDFCDPSLNSKTIECSLFVVPSHLRWFQIKSFVWTYNPHTHTHKSEEDKNADIREIKVKVDGPLHWWRLKGGAIPGWFIPGSMTEIRAGSRCYFRVFETGLGRKKERKKKKFAHASSSSHPSVALSCVDP